MALAMRVLHFLMFLIHYSNQSSDGQRALPGALPGDVAGALLHVRLETTSNFPTAFGTGISERCLNDSLTYMNAYDDLKPWALQSN